MSAPVRAPATPTAQASGLDEVLRRINRIRIEHGVDPLYELPSACTAWDGGGCVLERAFEDLGVVVVDHPARVRPGRQVRAGLTGFICDFDAGRYPQLVS